MNENNLYKKIKILIIMISIIIITLFTIILLNKYNNKYTHEKTELNEDNTYQYIKSKDVLILKNINMTYTLQTNINKYYNYIMQKNNTAVYYLLNQNYIKNNNINLNNVLNKLSSINEFEELWVEKVYYKQIEIDKETQYYIKCSILTKNYENKEYIYIIANFDFVNNTFSITPCDNINLNTTSFESIINNLKNQDNTANISVTKTINKNQFNDFYVLNIEDKSILKEYMRRYKINVTYYSEDAYNCLDKQYRDENFESIGDYIEYTKNNIKNMEIEKYRIDRFDDYTRYTVVNKNNQKIIFKEISPMQFTVIIEQ